LPDTDRYEYNRELPFNWRVIKCVKTDISPGILEQSRDRVGIGLSYRPAKSIHWNRYLGSWVKNTVPGVVGLNVDSNLE
jgi:hypothetical protein